MQTGLKGLQAPHDVAKTPPRPPFREFLPRARHDADRGQRGESSTKAEDQAARKGPPTVG